MRRRNRVDPFGNLIATPARGMLMGNRGCIHDQAGNIIKPWVRKQWVICLLEFKGRRRQIMMPGHYTELFFLDEATALAAGHRPCGSCQKARYEIFKHLWLNANQLDGSSGKGGVRDIDERLHAERLVSAGDGGLWKASLGQLPDGAMVTMESEPLVAWLNWRGRLYRWSPTGYTGSMSIAPSTEVNVITPRSVAYTMSEGYLPKVHATIDQAGSLAPARFEPDLISPVSFAKVNRRGEAETRPRVSPPASTDRVMHLHRLSVTPAGRELFTYFAAILRVTGMEHGGMFPLKKFLGNFATHEKAGRIEKIGNNHRLTQAGQAYFADRYRNGSRQHVDAAEVEVMMRMIRSGGKGWVAIA